MKTILMNLIMILVLVGCNKNFNPQNEPTQPVVTQSPVIEQTPYEIPLSEVKTFIQPNWCEPLNSSILPEKEVFWIDQNTQGIVKSLNDYANSINWKKMGAFSNLSLDGSWVTAVADVNGVIVLSNIVDQQSVLVSFIDPLFKYLDFEKDSWAMNNKKFIVRGSEYGWPYERNGISIVDLSIKNNIKHFDFILPEGKASSLHTIWSKDGNQIALFYYLYDQTTNTLNPKVIILDDQGVMLKWITLPKNSKNFIWAEDGIYFINEVSADQNIVYRIDINRQLPSLETIYKFTKPVDLLAINSINHQLLLNTRDEKSQTCFHSWNYLDNREEFSFVTNGKIADYYNGDRTLLIELFDEIQPGSQSLEYILFDWSLGFSKVKDAVDNSLGWNTQVNGYILKKVNYESTLLGLLNE